MNPIDADSGCAPRTPDPQLPAPLAGEQGEDDAVRPGRHEDAGTGDNWSRRQPVPRRCDEPGRTAHHLTARAPIDCPACGATVAAQWEDGTLTAAQSCPACGATFTADWPGFIFTPRTVVRDAS